MHLGVVIGNTARYRLTIAVLLLCTLALSACNPTRSQVIQRYAPQVDNLRRQLHTIAVLLPPPGAPPRPLNPASAIGRLALDTEGKRGTVAILLEEYLKDIYATPKIDPGLSEPMVSVLRWNGQRNPLSSSELKERPPGFSDYFDRTLSYAYILLLRIRPAVPDEPAGMLRIEAHLFDLEFVRLLGNVRFDMPPFPDTQAERNAWRDHLRQQLELAITPAPPPKDQD